MPVSRQINKYVGIHFSKGMRPIDLRFVPAGPFTPGQRRALGLQVVSDGPFTIEKMPCCGRKIRWETYLDVPTETTPCPCGADWSWVIKYEEEKP